jgi:hypothetical protein
MVPRNFFAGDFRIDCCYRDVKPSGFADIAGAAGSQHGPNRFTERRMARAVAVLTVAGAASSAPTAENPERGRAARSWGRVAALRFGNPCGVCRQRGGS